MSRRMKGWWGCGVYGARRPVYMVLVGVPEGKNCLEDRGIDGGIIQSNL
jgi:hypothetical protein